MQKQKGHGQFVNQSIASISQSPCSDRWVATALDVHIYFIIRWQIKLFVKTFMENMTCSYIWKCHMFNNYWPGY